MNTRLNHLITILTNLEPDQLNMHTWATECGTAACAAGWAALDPRFNRGGLRAGKYGQPTCSYHVDRPFHTLADFFGITVNQSLHLFSQYNYPDYAIGITPAQVIERIDDLLKGAK